MEAGSRDTGCKLTWKPVEILFRAEVSFTLDKRRQSAHRGPCEEGPCAPCAAHKICCVTLTFMSSVETLHRIFDSDLLEDWKGL